MATAVSQCVRHWALLARAGARRMTHLQWETGFSDRKHRSRLQCSEGGANFFKRVVPKGVTTRLV